MMKQSLDIRMGVFRTGLLFAASVLLCYVGYVQLFNKKYARQAESTSYTKRIKYASRGLIYDRKGNLLVNNGPVYDLKFTYNRLDPSMDVNMFCRVLDLTRSEYNDRINKDWKSNRFSKIVPTYFIRGLTEDQVQKYLELSYEFKGFELELRSKRGYEFESAAHVLGYLNEVEREDIERSDGAYVIGDYKGASGIEMNYEELLKGTKGIEYLLRDRMGRNIGKYNEGVFDSTANAGYDLVLGLDIELQNYCEELLSNKKGAIVAIEPSTGEILAIASAPNYDPDMLSIGRARSENYESLSQDSLKPFFNRSVMAKYPPGSILKPVMSLIALQEGVIDKDEKVECFGEYYYRHFRYGCHLHPPYLNSSEALAHSCNSYFFDAYRRITEQYGFGNPNPGLDKLADYFNAFGLGEELGIDIPGESSGFVPRSDYYDALYGANKWRSTYTLSLGIGQGELQLTTLQMANISAIIANRGYYVKPHLVSEVIGSQEVNLKKERAKQWTGIDKEHFIPVIDGMERTIVIGTAQNAYVEDVSVCGKTGTSQNSSGRDHSVFSAFAPKDNPQIAVAIYIENGGWGNNYAAPMAGLIIEKYLKGEISQKKKWIEQKMFESNLIDENS